MPTKKIKIPKLRSYAEIRSESIDQEKRTVEVVVTTEKPVLRGGWFTAPFMEVLDMKKESVRMGRMEAGAPFLDNHKAWGSVLDQIGVVEKAWLAGTEMKALVRFPSEGIDAKADQIFMKIKDGILRNISVGYMVHRYGPPERKNPNDEKEVPTRRATDWEPMEVSLVTVPADENAGVRSQEEDTSQLFECEFDLTNNERNRKMPTKKKGAPGADETVDNEIVETEVDNSDRETIRGEERARAAKILRACQQAKLPAKFAEELTKSNKTYEQCLEQVQEKWAQNDVDTEIRPNRSTNVEMSGLDEVDHRREGAVEAILARVAPKEHKVTERARQFNGRSAIEVARRILELNGIRTDMMSVNEICERSFHSTSDFTNILANVANKRLQKGYQSVPQLFREFGVETTLKDFKQNNVIEMGEADILEILPESAEIKMGTIGDSKEVYQLATYAKGLAVTRQILINDDLGAFSKAAEKFGRASARIENKVAFTDAIIGNPKMGDNVDLFHSSHKNLQSSTPLPPAEAQLAKMKALLRKQTDDKGNKLNLTAKWWIVGADYEVDAQKVVAPQSNSGGFNVFAEQFKVMVWPDLTTDHYLVADPSMIEGLEYAYLEGARGIQIETKDHPSTLGVIIRAYLDFGAKVINHRAFVKNAGA